MSRRRFPRAFELDLSDHRPHGTRSYAIAFVLLLVVTVLVVGRDAVLSRGVSGEPLRARTQPGARTVSWHDARWRLTSVDGVDLAAIPREEFEDPIVATPGTRVIETRLELTPSRTFLSERSLTCVLRLRSTADVRWDPGVLIPDGARAIDSATCSTDAAGKPLRAGKPAELRTRFTLPRSVPLDDLTLEIRIAHRGTDYLRLTRPD